jgi:hypothetical protein
MADYLTLQIFPNFFLAEMGKINELQAKKFGFIVFGFRGVSCGHRSMDSGLPKNNLPRFRIFRNNLSRPKVCE